MQFVGMTLNHRCVEPEFALQPLLAVPQGSFRLEGRRPDRREVESANRPGERVHVKISFEEARAVRDGEESGPAGVSAESTNTVGRDLDWLDDLGQKFKCGDVLYTLAVRVEDVRKAVEKANPVRSLLGVCVEDGQAIRRWDDSLEGLQTRGLSAHGPRRTQPVLGNARTDSLSNAPRFRAPGPVA